jgi:hypothetical protein
MSGLRSLTRATSLSWSRTKRLADKGATSTSWSVAATPGNVAEEEVLASRPLDRKAGQRQDAGHLPAAELRKRRGNLRQPEVPARGTRRRKGVARGAEPRVQAAVRAPVRLELVVPLREPAQLQATAVPAKAAAHRAGGSHQLARCVQSGELRGGTRREEHVNERRSRVVRTRRPLTSLPGDCGRILASVPRASTRMHRATMCSTPQFSKE